ncbi:MAG: WecB/TagA/CpsF family glycosyltransferase, partial [Spirochaetales bacterium]|nr:WecB/TagA/CpsF family glycosyltransferase [Spirochaetales bacterium]
NPILPTIKRVSLLNVPIDIFQQEHLSLLAEKIPQLTENRRIILLSFPSFLAAKLSRKRREKHYDAALIVSYSRIINRGIRFLYGEKQDLIYPFNFIISLLAALEKDQQSLYLLGEKGKILQQAHKNIKDSFPQIKIVGRYYGFFPRQEETNILLAIKKAQPSLLLAGRGLPGNASWLDTYRSDLKPGITLFHRRWYRIITGKKKRIPSRRAARIVYYGKEFLLHPWRLGYAVPYFLYNVLLLIQKIRK